MVQGGGVLPGGAPSDECYLLFGSVRPPALQGDQNGYVTSEELEGLNIPISVVGNFFFTTARLRELRDMISAFLDDEDQ
ncbi:hypothetical protein B0I12_002204 [Microbacterium hydrothermale]|nr:hypothetical protein [Microbacterium hydrothermale]